MKENFLHFVWQYQYFSKKELVTTTGDTVQIFAIGNYNTDGGPDFLNSRIKIGPVLWFGNVEIHLKSSDWLQHKHQNDKAYDNVVLHVVYKDDREITRTDGSPIPTISLENRIDQTLFNKYKDLVTTPSSQVACNTHFATTPKIIKLSMLEKALVSRLQKKADEVLSILNSNNGDWEETAFQVLCKNFGFKINSQPFLTLGKSISLKILNKHRNNLLQIEALLYGQAGMLERKFKDDYPQKLQKEYDFLVNKYNLHHRQLNSSEWKFMRMRPANFPTVRLAQLAKFVQTAPPVFSLFTEAETPDQITKYLKVTPSEYWQKHYMFEKENSKGYSKIGTESVLNLLINTVVPLMAAVARARDNESLLDKAVKFLELIPAEKNRISKGWNELGFDLGSAADTQGGTELFNSFCKNKLCLNCNIGVAIIKN